MRDALAHRIEFWLEAARAGWPTMRVLVWLPTTLLGLSVVTYVAFGLDRPLLAALLGLAVVGASLGEGAFQIANVLLESLRSIRRAEQQRAHARAQHTTWAEEVRTFIDARQALRPPEPRSGHGLHELLSGKPAPSEPEAARKAREAHDRETVSQYIERYRASGLELFERGVADRRIVDTLTPRGVDLAQIDGGVSGQYGAAGKR
jgi:hypothetical protein